MANQSYGSISPPRPQTTSAKTAEERRAAGEIVDFTGRGVRLAADGGLAEVVINQNTVVMATDANTALGISDGCLVLDGKVSFTHTVDDICFNGFFRLNQDLLQTLPSTLANPIETLVFKYPNKVKLASKMTTLLAG